MNKRKRGSLKMAITYLNSAIDIVSSVKNDEQYSLDNMPENLETSERYESMENAIDSLEDALDSIESAKSSIDEAIA